MQRLGQRRERFTVELKFERGGLDNNELHDAFRGQQQVDLVFMGKSFTVRLNELKISHDAYGVDTYCAGEALYR